MAFDLTKPSATATNFAAAFGDIRENFRAIVQGDASVFTQMQITSTASPHVASLLLGRSGQTAKARVAGIGTGTHEALDLTVNATYDGSNWQRDDTARVAWLTALDHNGDNFAIYRAAAAANPIAWTELFRVNSSGNVGIGGAPSAALDVIRTATCEIAMRATSAGSPLLTMLHTGGTPTIAANGTLRFGTVTGVAFAGFAEGMRMSGTTRFVGLGTGAEPGVRLHIGAGGTGTQAEQVYIDAGSGTGGQPSLHWLRNTALRATMGIVATASSLITGSSVNDLAVVNNGAILFSVDAGTTLHAFIDTSGRFRAKALMTDGATPSVGPGIIAFGTTTATTVGAAGGGAAQPATPVGYLVINIAGTNYKIPYHNN